MAGSACSPSFLYVTYMNCPVLFFFSTHVASMDNASRKPEYGRKKQYQGLLFCYLSLILFIGQSAPLVQDPLFDRFCILWSHDGHPCSYWFVFTKLTWIARSSARHPIRSVPGSSLLPHLGNWDAGSALSTVSRSSVERCVYGAWPTCDNIKRIKQKYLQQGWKMQPQAQ